MRRFLALLISSAALWILPQASWAVDMRVLLILSDNTSPYQSFTQKLKDALPGSIQLVTQESGKPATASVDLVVAVGMKAAEAAISTPSAPILAVMVPKGGYNSLIVTQRIPQSISAIYLDQPWGRQLNFLYALIPELNKIGLVYSPENYPEVSDLLNTATGHGSSVSAQVVRSEDGLFAGLEKALSGSDVLLAIPDSRIYNAGNIRNILLTSYRHKVPLIGFSQGYVNAGALAAIFTHPEQIAAQTARQIMAFDQKRALATPRYPDEFAIAVNLQVARSLGIRLPTEFVIRKRMSDKGEGG